MTPQIPGQLTYLSPEEWRHVVRCGTIPASIAPAYHKEEPPPKSKGHPSWGHFTNDEDQTRWFSDLYIPSWAVFLIGFAVGAIATMPLWFF